jgi:hypothetical protein
MYLDEWVAKANKCAKKAWDLAGAHPIEIKNWPSLILNSWRVLSLE